ncbi:ribokinase [Calothrix sp. 336/3]|uniref:ribokinase n=1 Tax=Calothrix sp. 336/3 TaxID=1337936 RepID=UPI0004E2FD8C|nr:ribokinase [Calothrix sp. 336/3]AKG23841.1 ribokinase [Calothrix sp. 336/3]
MSIIVFGSINIDLVATAPRLPLPGETLRGRDFFKAPGGKGANQAVALAKLGVTTHIVGRVGSHGFGAELLHHLQTVGVETKNIFIDETVSSGVAIITVDDGGENEIIVIPGANGNVSQADVDRMSDLLPEATALLLQLEIPISAVLAAAKVATEAGVTVILDPAPVESNLPDELYPLVDIITPNEVEAGQLVGFPVNDVDSAIKAAQILQKRGVKTAIVKLGSQGVVCATNHETFFTPAFPVVAIDTVAAGDAFNGALATALSEGKTLQQAVIWGAAAGALTATKSGAQPSLPDRFTLNEFLMLHGQ